ncbi:MAG: hypothetical protein VYE62_03445 [Pseudomonadota bacterium]|nr:hypothetical protein [Pseudomonadota bacterium]
MHRVLILLFLLFACGETSRPERPEIKTILAEDRENKELELFYLSEIRVAEENNDSEAFRFYLEEYMKVPRLDIPEWMKEEPEYFLGGDRVKY